MRVQNCTEFQEGNVILQVIEYRQDESDPSTCEKKREAYLGNDTISILNASYILKLVAARRNTSFNSSKRRLSRLHSTSRLISMIFPAK